MPLIFDYLAGLSYRLCPSPLEEADLVLGGSLLGELRPKKRSRLTKDLHVWGSGFRDQPHGSRRSFPDTAQFHAVRGHLSRQFLEEKNLISGKCPLGDPGVFCRELLNLQKPKKKKWQIGFMPHYADHNNPYFEKIIKKFSSIKFINVLSGTPKIALKNIAASEMIISSSLHGLIAADALGIPNLHIKFSDAIPDFKYRDYYSAFGLEDISDCFDVREGLEALTCERILKNPVPTRESLETVKQNFRKAFEDFLHSFPTRTTDKRISRHSKSFFFCQLHKIW